MTDVYVHIIHSVFAGDRHLVSLLYLCRARNEAERRNLFRNFPADMLVRDDVRDAFHRLQPAADHQALIDQVRAQDFSIEKVHEEDMPNSVCCFQSAPHHPYWCCLKPESSLQDSRSCTIQKVLRLVPRVPLL